MNQYNIQFNKSTGEDGNSFVGIKIIGNDVCFYYPESYSFNPEDYSRNDVIELLSTISIAKTTADNKNENAFNSV